MALPGGLAVVLLFGFQLLFAPAHAHLGYALDHGRFHRKVHHRNLGLIDVNATPTSSSSLPAAAVSGNYGTFVLGSQTRIFSLASSAVLSTSTATPICPGCNGTTLATPDKSYQLLCNVDFAQQDISPFVKAGSFADCLSSCDSHNNGTSVDEACVGVVFVPGRSGPSYADNCYLKSALGNASAASTPLIGAIPATASVNLPTMPTSTVTQTPSLLSVTTSMSSFLASSSNGTSTGNSPHYASGTAIVPPSFKDAQLLGASQNRPTTQYVNQSSIKPIILASGLLATSPNPALINDYPVAPDTGCRMANSSSSLTYLSGTPHLSRDGGKGGNLNGQNIFIFCDTATYSANGDFLGFVSSSVAIDEGMNALNGQPLTLQDGIGEWSDDVGRLRGFAPMTTGEEAYNLIMAGNGYRYAIWPGSSLIPFNATDGLIYANIIYDVVDMSTQAANFTCLGNTLLSVTTDEYGPVSTRVVNQMFTQDEVNFGAIGGIRSWGPTGPGGNDGRVYVLGAGGNGILSGRVDVQDFADKTKYEYWDGESWSTSMPSNSFDAYLISVEIMDIDIFYSPRHLTFIMIYLTKYADNTFYYRYLNSSKPIIPGYAGGDSSSDYVEQIVHGPWSVEEVLYKAAEPPSGNYIYDGSFHAGYFGDDDLIEGGNKMLLSWTQHTGLDATSAQSGYAHITVVLTVE